MNEMQMQQDYQEIDLIELALVMWHRKWIILLCFIVMSVAGFGYTAYGITPQYTSATTLMVNGAKGLNASDLMESFDLGSINMSQKLVVTYSEIVKSRLVLEQVISRLQLEETYTELYEKIEAVPVKNTEILQIEVTDVSAQGAADIANAIVAVFDKEVMRILKVNNVEIIDKAIPIEKPVNISKTKNTVIAGILGIMMGMGIIFMLEMLNQTLRTEQDVEKHLGMAPLGAVPNFEHFDDKEAKAKA